ncbi:MAG: response regulator [Spirochaetia bacterium]
MAEDNPINTIYIQRLLEKNGYKVDLAKDGKEVVYKWQNNDKYDLILMDVQMPVSNGINATTEIRSIEKRDGKNPIPIIAVTAYDTSDEKEHMLAVGANNYITKPIDIHSLLSVIAETKEHKPFETGAETEAEAASEISEEQYERKLLQEFKDVEETLAEMLRMTLREFPQRLSAIGDALSARDFDTAAKNCHSLANVAGILRAEELRDKAVQLERILINEPGEESYSLFVSIEKRAFELMRIFRKLLEEKL